MGTSRAVVPSGGATRVLVLNQHAMVARALAVALDRHPEIEVVSSAGSMSEGLTLAREFRPAVIVLHDPLPDATVTTATIALGSAVPRSAVLVMASKVSERFVTRALAAGAAGVVDRSAPLVVLEHAVRACARGERRVIERGLLPGAFGDAPARSGASGSNELTIRELEVLSLLDAGLDAARIAERLVIARNTARNHIQRVLVKLGAHSRHEAVAIARREGLLPS
jgi:DNA-binding NarL/FixJ family response regulator